MKIKYTNLDKILEQCTAKEIDLMLEIAQYQNDKGLIEAIDYKTICNNIDICYSSFFKLLKSLELKEIIKIDYLNEDYGFWRVLILDNDLSNKETYKDGYININNEFLHSLDFKKLKQGEKVIILNLFKIAHNRHIVKITMQTLIKWTGFQKQAIMRYMKHLKHYINIDKINNLFIFNVNSHFFRKSDTEKNIKNQHKISYLVKKNRIASEINQIKAVANLFNQYSKISPTIIFEIIEKSIKKIGTVEVKYIHKHLSNYLKYADLK